MSTTQPGTEDEVAVRICDCIERYVERPIGIGADIRAMAFVDLLRGVPTAAPQFRKLTNAVLRTTSQIDLSTIRMAPLTSAQPPQRPSLQAQRLEPPASTMARFDPPTSTVSSDSLRSAVTPLPASLRPFSLKVTSFGASELGLLRSRSQQRLMAPAIAPRRSSTLLKKRMSPMAVALRQAALLNMPHRNAALMASMKMNAEPCRLSRRK